MTPAKQDRASDDPRTAAAPRERHTYARRIDCAPRPTAAPEGGTRAGEGSTKGEHA